MDHSRFQQLIVRSLEGPAPLLSWTPTSSHTIDEAEQQELDTWHILRPLNIGAVAVSCLSLLMTTWTLYWFVRIRRSFRHELILLLIQSDFLKSLAFFILPIANLTGDVIQSDSHFCQVAGFATAVGIQSSDIAVFLIAVHSLMYIFRPRSGLYPYRHYAFILYYLFPITTASLAFIGGGASENLGHYCYFRTDEPWEREVLSWIPRYIVCLSIIAIYTFIFVYSWWGMGGFGRERFDALHRQPSPAAPRKECRAKFASMPRLSYHGLIPSTPCSRRTSTTDTVTNTKERGRAGSLPSSAEGSESRRGGGGPAVNFGNWMGFTSAPADARGGNNASGGPPRRSVDSAQDPMSPPLTSPLPQLPPPALSPPSRLSPVPEPEICFRSAEDAAPQTVPPGGRRVSFRSSVPLEGDAEPGRPRVLSMPLLTPVAEWPPSTTPAVSPNTPPPGTLDDIRTAMTTDTVASLDTRTPSLPLITTESEEAEQNRRKTLRQLTSLFIYPLVYIIAWVFPFVCHILGYDNVYRHPIVNPSAVPYYPGQLGSVAPFFARTPRWLLVTNMVGYCIQGTVDSTVFLWREKPWRLAAGRTFFEGIRKRWAWRRARFLEVLSRVGFALGIHWIGPAEDTGSGGRTREEMLLDGQLARERRANEVAAEKERERQRELARKRKREEERARLDTEAAERSQEGSAGRGRQWWDAFDDEYMEEEGEEGHDNNDDDGNRRRGSGVGSVASF
ncbi:hypothetical protein VTJ49DRAFT_5065 [Mycothermus thermophilus]|uniref:BZIP domain-containing protein n=1 Tax=Humicola insolens TaxID=85995 RepID=A0ABR3V4J8_HUMIN